MAKPSESPEAHSKHVMERLHMTYPMSKPLASAVGSCPGSLGSEGLTSERRSLHDRQLATWLDGKDIRQT